MNRKVKSSFVGQCPRFGEPHSIVITYAEIPILGSSAPGYKKMSFTCDSLEDCPNLDRHGSCPLLLNAPDVPK